jgi:hypothetical protein
MGQILHGCATTTEAIHRAIQNSQASLRELAARHGIIPRQLLNGAGVVRSATLGWGRGNLAPQFSAKRKKR